MKKETIEKIVKASGVTKGEFILVQFWGNDEDISVMHQFAEAVVALGASVMELQQSRVHNGVLFSKAGTESFGDKYFSIFEQVDAVLDVFMYQPVILDQKLPDEQMDVCRTYMRRIFQTFVQKKRFTEIRIPTEANVLESGLDPKEVLPRLEAAYDLDYEKLQQECEDMKKKLSQKEELTLETGEGCQLQFSLKDRDWILDCGDGDWPCGEVYLPPVEEKTEGTVYYPRLFIEDLGWFDQVTLTVEHGVVTQASQPEVQKFLNGLSKEDRTVCELGFGCNDQVKELCGYIVLDEKMKDTFHIAIGMNSMFGGKNEAKVHIDFVNQGGFTMR